MTRLHPDVERLALIGWRLAPASQFSRASCIKRAADLATCDLDRLEQWCREFPGCGWRVVMQGSGIWALDLDVPGASHKHDGVSALRELIAVHGPLPMRPTTRSGSGGLALFFHHAGEPIIGASGSLALGIDPLRGRQSVTVPPSIHPLTQCPYRWLVAPWEVASPPTPAWLLRLLAPLPASSVPVHSARLPDRADGRLHYTLAALRRAADRVATAPEGTRNYTLNAETFGLTRLITEGLLDAQTVATAMAYAGRQAGLPPSEIKGTLASALSTGVQR